MPLLILLVLCVILCGLWLTVFQRQIQRNFAGFNRTHLWLKIPFSMVVLRTLTKLEIHASYLPYIFISITLGLILLLNKSIFLPANMCKIAVWEPNSVDPDQMPRSAVSDLGLHFCSGMSVRIYKVRTAIWSNRPLRNHSGSAPVFVHS